jgi:hypothetical protein
MSMKSALRSLLLSNAAIVAVVGDRVAWDTSAQVDSQPRLALSQIAGDHSHHMKAAAGTVIGRVQITAFASTSLAASNLAELVRLAIDGFRGGIDDVEIGTCHLVDERSFYHPPQDGSDKGTFDCQSDYVVNWYVTIPTFDEVTA